MKKRLIKITIWFLGTLIALVLLISGSLYFFKDTICGYVISEVNLNLKAKVKVEKVDLAFWGSFPNLSVDFNNVFIQDAYNNSTEKDTLLYSNRIRLKFNPIDIWNEKYNVKSIEILPGTIQLKINKKGQNNYDILKAKKDTVPSKFHLNLENVSFTNMRFSFKNENSEHYYSTFLSNLDLQGDFSEKKYTLHSKSNLIINEAKSGNVALISNKSAYFDIDILVNQLSNTIEIPNALVYVSNLPFHLTGKISNENLNFKIRSENLNLDDVVTNFSHASIDEIKKIGGSGNVYFDVTINAATNSYEAPKVNCIFGINNGALREPIKGIKLKNIFLNGKYSNVGSKEYLQLSKVDFNSPGGPFSGEIMLTNFDNPIYDGKAKGNLDLNVIQRLFPIPTIDSIIGAISINSVFNVQVLNRLNGSKDFIINQCDGNVKLKNVGLKLIDDKRFFNKINGLLVLKNNDIDLQEIELKIRKSDLLLNGNFEDVSDYLSSEKSLTASLDISSNFLDIQDLSEETKQEQIADGKNWILPDDIKATISLKAEEIKYESHRFKKFNGEMTVKNHAVEFSELMLQNASADIRGDVNIEEKSPEIFTITTNLTSENIEFKSLFKEWNNFEQEIIKEDNISGKAKVNLSFSAPFDLKNGVIKNLIKSQISIKISEGKLKNVIAFKEITESMKTSSAKYVLKKTNINEFEKKLLDLKFDEFENTFIIKNGMLEIPSMKIKSNALELDLRGKHSFDNKIDYHFSFNLRQIRTQKKDSEFGTIEDDEQGMKVFLRMFGDVYNPTIIWDQEAKKTQAKENREEAKKEAKSILKTEFGMFKNDTSVKTYQPAKKPKEEIIIEFGNTKKDAPIEEPKKQKKDSKLNNTLKKWKEEAEKDKQEVIEGN